MLHVCEKMIIIEDLKPIHVNNTDIVSSLIQEYDNDPDSYVNHPEIVYCFPLLKHVNLYTFSKTCINTMINRCIEYNLYKELQYIFSLNINKNISKSLYLRKIGSISIYVYASTHGYQDIELNKRIIWFQRIIRARRNNMKHESYRPSIYEHVYRGPNIKTYYINNKYFGYRKSYYKCRWDKKNKDLYYGSLMELNCYGNCEWQAYMDYYKLE